MNLGKILTYFILILLITSPVMRFHYWPWSNYPMYSWKISSKMLVYYDTKIWLNSKPVVLSTMEARRVSYLLLQSIDISGMELRSVLAKLFTPELMIKKPRVKISRFTCQNLDLMVCDKKEDIIFDDTL